MSARAKCPHCGGEHGIPEMVMGGRPLADPAGGPAVREPDDASVTCPHCGGTYHVPASVFDRSARADDSGDLLRAAQWRRAAGGPVSVRRLPPGAFIGHVGPLIVAGGVVHGVLALIMGAISHPNGVGVGEARALGPLWQAAAVSLAALLVVSLFPLVVNWRGSRGSGLRILLGPDVLCPPGLRNVVRVDTVSAAKVGGVVGAVIGFAWLCLFGAGLAVGGAIPGSFGERVLVLLSPAAGGLEGVAVGLLCGSLYSALASAWGGMEFAAAPPGPIVRNGQHEAELRDVDPGDLGVALAGVGLILGAVWAVIATLAGALSLSATTGAALRDSVGGLMATGPFALVGLPLAGFVVGVVVALVYNFSTRIAGGLAIEIR